MLAKKGHAVIIINDKRCKLLHITKLKEFELVLKLILFSQFQIMNTKESQTNKLTTFLTKQKKDNRNNRLASASFVIN